VSVRRVAIIGNGIAGITAARHIRKRSDHEITVISAESDHFFSRTALMYIYMGHMTLQDTQPYEDGFWEKNRIRLMRAWVEAVDTQNKILRVAGGQDVPYDDLILATGSRSNKFGWPGQDLRGVQGLYSLQDLESMERHTSGVGSAVIVGGGLIGIETAEMLLSRGIGVTFLVRESSWMNFAFPDEESKMINRHILEHGVDLRLGEELSGILPDERGRVRAVTTKDGEEIPCSFVALTVGVGPNVGFLEGSGIDTDRGVLVDAHLATNVPDVYAIGDCAQLREPRPGRRPVEAVWYVGRAMGETLARTLTGEPTRYVQDIWFNSAKFFDIEWQIYGDVPAQVPEGQESLYWEDPGAHKSIRINYRLEDEAVTGFNLMGVRYRHEVCDAWLREGRSIRHVLEHLGAANFDPEFYRQHEQDLVAVFNRRHPDKPVTLRTRRGLSGWLALAAGASR
jgi:NAD(P)H-nitrite reductase large subunit